MKYPVIMEIIHSKQNLTETAFGKTNWHSFVEIAVISDDGVKIIFRVVE